MYELWLIKDGTQKVIDLQRDPQVASGRAIEQSKLLGGIIAVIRQGFTDPLYYVQDGQLRGALDTIRMLTVPTVHPESATDLTPPKPAETPLAGPKPRARTRKPSEVKARGGKPDIFKQYPATVTAIDEENGIVEAIVNVFGIIDDGDDVVHAGAFAKTLAENGTRVRVLDSHNNRSALSVVGKPLDIREVGRDQLPQSVLLRYPDATGGLYTKTQYLLNTPEGRGVFERIKSGALDEYSIGFDATQTDNERINDGTKSRVVRNIRQVRLWEYSPVIWGMNPATGTVSVKGVSGAANLPLADRERAWDGTAAEQRVRAWAGGEDNMDWTAYRKAFFWYDSENGENFTAYKLGFADIVDGELTAIPRGIFATAGGRGVNTADIPDADKAQIRGKINAYYARMRSEFDDETVVSPFEQDSKEYTPQGAIRRLGDVLLADLMQGGSWVLTAKLSSGMISAEEFATLSALYTLHINEFRAMMTDDIALRELDDGMYWFGADAAGEHKAGRVLNERNYLKIKQAGELLAEVLSSAGLTDDDSSAEKRTDGPSVSTDAPTPSEGAGPQDDETPAANREELLRQRLANLEAK